MSELTELAREMNSLRASLPGNAYSTKRGTSPGFVWEWVAGSPDQLWLACRQHVHDEGYTDQPSGSRVAMNVRGIRFVVIPLAQMAYVSFFYRGARTRHIATVGELVLDCPRAEVSMALVDRIPPPGASRTRVARYTASGCTAEELCGELVAASVRAIEDCKLGAVFPGCESRPLWTGEVSATGLSFKVWVRDGGLEHDVKLELCGGTAVTGQRR